MKRKNFSHKREAILSIINSTKTHPTAEWVFQELKPLYPSISLGTVYRNISDFKKDGLITSVGVIDGKERLDGNTREHAHFVCSCCDSVLDIDGVKQNKELIEQICAKYNIVINSSELVFRGTCLNCLK